MGITNERLEALRNGNPLRDYVLNYLLKAKPAERQRLLADYREGEHGGETTRLFLGDGESRALGMVCFEFASYGLERTLLAISRDLDLPAQEPDEDMPF